VNGQPWDSDASIDPDTGVQDLDVFRRIRTEFNNELALNCWVIQPGEIAPGDTARIVDTAAHPRDIGGWIVGAPYDVAPDGRLAG
jgi:hypothetical protein